MQNLRKLFPYVLAMALTVIVSNVLVQYPFAHFGLGELLTWGAFTYPFAFLVNDLSNRQFGSSAAKKVVAIGFLIAVILSIFFATPRIALASGSAFLVAHLIDIGIFEKLRNRVWWKPPLFSSLVGSMVDTLIFFSLAFAPLFSAIDGVMGYPDGSLAFPATLAGISMPLWVSLAVGDFFVKILIGIVALAPYALLLSIFRKGIRAN